MELGEAGASLTARYPALPELQRPFQKGLCPVALSLVPDIGHVNTLPAARPSSRRERGTAAGAGLGVRGVWAPVQPRERRGIWVQQAPASFWVSVFSSVNWEE